MENNSTDAFRDKPINIDETGKSKRIVAKQPKGKWYNRRTYFAWFCILFLIFAPIIKINGNPLMLFDIVNRKFSLFGNMFYPQDTFILALIMLVAVVCIVLFTVIYGRLFCGWACPQTIFLEMIYRRIEYLFDGNHRNLSNEKYDEYSKIIRTIGKHLVYIIISFIITNVFIMWFTGPEKLWQIISSPISENQLGFLFMAGVSLFYYFVYAYLRQQICTFFCPYGRLQGVLLDSKSISVIYDYKRGEPRGSKNTGDCIDCKQCIAVCPTGVDIRNGSQFECINCTACIDECNIVMEKVKKPGNLIRFDSYHGIETGKHSIKNARTYAYSAVLLILVIVLGITVSKRTSVDVSINRMQGTMCQEIDINNVSNIYTVKLINKSNKLKNISFKLIDIPNGDLQFTTDISQLEAGAAIESVLMLKLPKTLLKGRSTDLEIGVYDSKTLLSTYTINFIGLQK
jgi:cytochrome c oxidase accessory protein FixG